MIRHILTDDVTVMSGCYPQALLMSMTIDLVPNKQFNNFGNILSGFLVNAVGNLHHTLSF